MSDIPHVYEIEIRDNGSPVVSYRRGDKPRRSFNVETFIKKVNKARRRANYPYKMLRQPLSPQPEPETAPSYTSEERIEITNTIFRHMGGSGRLTAMIGMHNPVVLDSPVGLKFNFRGSRKANICKVIYNPGSDTYDLELYYYTRVRYAHCPKVYEATDVYCDMLQDLFEAETGLYLTL